MVAVLVTGRLDCCFNNLDGLQVRVGQKRRHDQNHELINEYPLCGEVHSRYVLIITISLHFFKHFNYSLPATTHMSNKHLVECPQEMKGRFVSLQLPSSSAELEVNEVDVFVSLKGAFLIRFELNQKLCSNLAFMNERMY